VNAFVRLRVPSAGAGRSRSFGHGFRASPGDVWNRHV